MVGHASFVYTVAARRCQVKPASVLSQFEGDGLFSPGWLRAGLYFSCSALS
jgi:hypothetical protein